MKKSSVVLRNPLFVLSCLVLSIVLNSSAAWARNARILQPIDDSARVALPGNVRPLPSGAADLGTANASLPSGRMLLVLKRSAAEDSDLKQLLSDLQDKNSANYHKWLTPAQYADRFGVAAADAQTLTSWLEAHGFTVHKVSAGRTSIEFSGTIGQLQSAFHTSIHRYAVNGEEHLANTTDPAIPAALAPVVSGLVGLNDFFPRNSQTANKQAAAAHASYDKQTHTAKPEFTATAGGNVLYVGPADAATIYDTPNPYNANFKGSQTYLGNNITIAVVSDANINTSDVANYRSFFGLPANTPQVIIDGNDPGVDANTTGDTQKALRDVEIAGALAPNANVILYTAADTTTVPGLFLALSRAVDDNLSDIIEFGFSDCEADLRASNNNFIRVEWEQAAVGGVTVVAAAGDSGSAGCDAPANDSNATRGLAVNGYASTPYNIAVGGTDFDTLPSNFSTYVGSNGIAKSYIPEQPWNNSTAVNRLLAANTPYTDANGYTNDFAGGGGASGTYSKPSWQSGSGNLNIPQDHVRDLPDVSLLAGTGQYGATWAVCGNDYDTSGNPLADCAGSPATIQGLGGTSAAASAFAGILALVAQSQNGRLGQANFVLYNLANQASLYGSVFHDVATGNNSVVCAAGSTNCGSNDFLSGYNAATEYDQASGLGSVDATQLISNWKNASFLQTTTTLAITLANGAAIPATLPHGTPITIDITVAGSGGPPTGSVGVIATVDGSVNSNTYGDDAGFTGALKNGSFSTTLSNEPGGNYTSVAVYGGDPTFAASTSSPIAFTVTPEPSKLLLHLLNSSGTQQTSGSTYPYGTYLSVDAQPVGASGQGIATGNVTFLDNGQPVLNAAGQPVTFHTPNLNRRGFAEIPNYYWAFGSHSITANYPGDNSFNPSPSSPPLNFTIGQGTTTVKVTPVPLSVISGTVAVTVTVAGSGTGGNPPSGTVTLVDTTNAGNFSSGTLVAGSYTFTIQASQLAFGPNTLTATYAGDTNYTGSTGTGTVTRLTVVGTTLTMTANPTALATGSTTITGQITPVSSVAGTAPTGLVTLVDSTNGAQLGTAPLLGGTQNGIPIATFTLAVNSTSLTLGPNTITATYAGDPNYSGSSGSVVVTLLNPSFTIAATPVTIATPGQTTGNTSTITVTPQSGFTGQVNLTTAFVSGPGGATSPPTVTLSASAVTITGPSPATATATITTTALTYAMQRPADKIPSRWYEGGGLTLAGLLLLGIPARRRAWRGMLALLLFIGIGVAVSSTVGCGVHLNAVKTYATSPGTYVFSVTGVDQATGLVKASTTITVTVQ